MTIRSSSSVESSPALQILGINSAFSIPFVEVNIGLDELASPYGI